MSAKVRQTQAERREEAERRLIQAAIELISERGFHNLTLADVGEKAGYSRGLPAHYFGLRENLVIAVANHILGTFATYADRASSSAVRGMPRLLGRLRAFARAARQNRVISRATVMIYTDALVNEALAATLIPLIHERLESYRAELHAGMELGNVRRDIDVEAQAAGIFAFVRGTLILSQLVPDYPLEAASEAYIGSLAGQLSPTSSDK